MKRPALSHVVGSLNPGGAERLVVEMSRAFADEYDVQVVCLDEPGEWAQQLRGCGIPVHVLWRQPGFDPSIPAKLGDQFRRHRSSIVHAHQCTPWFYSALARIFHPAARLLLEEHGRFYPELRSRSRTFLNRLLISRMTHRFIAVSQDIRSRLEQYEGLDASRIEVIYNGVRPLRSLDAEERAAARRGLGFAADHFVVGTVGRFDPIKNLALLVASLDVAGAQNPNVRGLLVGDGPDYESIRALLAKSSMHDRVQLTGYRSDIPQLVQCLDVFVLSSLSEGTSMALLEAMSAGVPVIVTEVGGNTEVVRAGETGWTVPSSSPDALAAAIIEASTDSTKRSRYAEAARARYKSDFSLEGMLDKYRTCYRELLET